MAAVRVGAVQLMGLWPPEAASGSEQPEPRSTEGRRRGAGSQSRSASDGGSGGRAELGQDVRGQVDEAWVSKVAGHTGESPSFGR